MVLRTSEEGHKASEGRKRSVARGRKGSVGKNKGAFYRMEKVRYQVEEEDLEMTRTAKERSGKEKEACLKNHLVEMEEGRCMKKMKQGVDINRVCLLYARSTVWNTAL